MRWARRIAAAVAALLVLSATAATGGWFWLKGGVPRLDGEARLEGLGAPVEVWWDAHAIPHIRAASDADAYFALGYLHARDRLWQMESQRMVGAGRLAELVGADGVRLDRLMRTLDFHGLAQSSYEAMAPEARAALDAYAAGVNAWIEGDSGPLPVEFQLLGRRPEPWTPADSLVWQKLMALQLSANYRDELLRAGLLRHLPAERVRDLFPTYPDGAPATLAADLGHLRFERALAALPPPLGPDTASNEWVVDGGRTETGKPILVNDPHLALQAPILWYLARIETPTLSVTGATVPGVPFHVLGHNADVAWGFTTTGSDVQDLFVERVDPADSARYLTPDGSAAFETRREIIRVKGGEPEELTVRATRHGPVLSDIDPEAAALGGAGEVLALAFTGLAPGDRTAEALYHLNRARDWADFVGALSRFRSPQQNVVYADRAGNIGFYSPGAVPIRKSGDGRVPVPGWTGGHDWTGLVPFEELPHALNPPSGMFVNANNRVVGPDYPHLLTTDWEAPYRAARIDEALRDATPQTIDTSEALLADTRSLAARDLLPLLTAAEPLDARSAAALDRLRGWDGAMDRDRPEPLIYAAWMHELGRALVADELGELAAAYGDPGPRVAGAILRSVPHWCDDVTTPEAEDCAAVLSRSLASSLGEVAATHGDDPGDWRWGDAHVAPLAHPVLSRVPVLADLFGLAVATNGGNDTVNRGQSRRDRPFGFSHIHGAGYRAVYDLADLANSRFVIATGQSGNPLSPHYGDLVEMWRDGVHLRLARSTAELEQRGLGRLVLQPRR